MSSHLDPEISAALNYAGLRPLSFLCISNIQSPEIDRITYRINHTLGIIKARRLENETVVRRLYDLRRELPDSFVPILFRNGRVILEKWIDGHALPETPESGHLEAAGTLLGKLHAGNSLDCRPVHNVYSTAGHLVTAERSLRHLSEAGAIGKNEELRLSRQMHRLDPGRAIHGLVHFDFCGENMVLDNAGRLFVVDNERIGLNALGFDLARSWYRWALPEPSWEHFCSIYAKSLPFSEPLDTLRFWKFVAVVRAAALRMRVYPERAAGPIAVLNILASEASS